MYVYVYIHIVYICIYMCEFIHIYIYIHISSISMRASHANLKMTLSSSSSSAGWVERIATPPPINSAEYEHKAATHRKRVARFMSNPEPTHIAAAKRVLRYLAGTRSVGITYRRGAVDPSLLSVGVRTAPDQLSASADSDHAGADDRRSVSGWAIMLAGAMIAWTSKHQPVTAISITESEFYSVSQCALDCVYLRRIMELLEYEQTAPILNAQDNNACIFLVKGGGMYARANYIDTRVHRVREFAAEDKPEVKLFKIAGEYQPADIFTKGLPRVAFQHHRRTIMGE